MNVVRSLDPLADGKKHKQANTVTNLPPRHTIQSLNSLAWWANEERHCLIEPSVGVDSPYGFKLAALSSS